MEEITVSLGTNLVSANERMTSISLIELYERIAHANSAFTNQIEVLRSIYKMDGNKYTLTKKFLPYFVCAHFEPGVRRLENFISTISFVLDIDNIDEDTITMDELRNKLDKDGRIVMMFTSPSGNGLKLLFRLDKPCLDYNVYSTFYKQFASEFAQEHHLEAFIDLKTNDVTRGCTRVQKSIFMASLPSETINDISQKLIDIQRMYDNNDSILVVPLSDDYARAMKIIGQEVNLDLILHDKNTLFF